MFVNWSPTIVLQSQQGGDEKGKQLFVSELETVLGTNGGCVEEEWRVKSQKIEMKVKNQERAVSESDVKVKTDAGKKKKEDLRIFFNDNILLQNCKGYCCSGDIAGNVVRKVCDNLSRQHARDIFSRKVYGP